MLTSQLTLRHIFYASQNLSFQKEMLRGMDLSKFYTRKWRFNISFQLFVIRGSVTSNLHFFSWQFCNCLTAFPNKFQTKISRKTELFSIEKIMLSMVIGKLKLIFILEDLKFLENWSPIITSEVSLHSIHQWLTCNNNHTVQPRSQSSNMLSFRFADQEFESEPCCIRLLLYWLCLMFGPVYLGICTYAKKHTSDYHT